MKRTNLEEMTAEQLVDRFAEIGIRQDEALLYSEIGKFNRRFGQMMAIENELKGRAGDQRRALLALYDHDNTQVRLNAAKATLAVAPEAARAVIEAIANSQRFPQAGDAGMTLADLDRGVFNPT